MAKKTFKIGEYCKGGIISVEINKLKIDVIGKEWISKKEWTRKTVLSTSNDAERELGLFLNDLTTSYYTDKVLDWIKTKTKFETTSIW